MWSRPALVFVLLCIPEASASYKVKLTPAERQCMSIRTPKDRPAQISGNYDLLNDDLPRDSVSVWLIESGPGNHKTTWNSYTGAGEETFNIGVEADSRMDLCFESEVDNDAEDPVDIEVGFHVRVTPAPRTLPDSQDGPDAQRALKLLDMSVDIREDWNNLMDHFDFLRNREALHQALTNQILSRVMGWTILEAFLVVSMAIAQVLYWKKFFETRRYL